MYTKPVLRLDANFFFFCDEGIWTLWVDGADANTTEKHPSLCHLHRAVSAGGHVHGMFQQHCHHHTLPAHTCLHGKTRLRH